jgi:hypothetical protein
LFNLQFEICNCQFAIFSPLFGIALFARISYDPPAFLDIYQKKFVKEDEHELNEDPGGHGPAGCGRVLDLYVHGPKTGVVFGRCTGISKSPFGADTRPEFTLAAIGGRIIERTGKRSRDIT